MQSIWKITLAVLALALAFNLPQRAQAETQTAEAETDLSTVWTIFPPAAPDAEDQNNAGWITPPGWNISILLPYIGTYHQAGDADWESGSLDFQWFDGDNAVGTGGIFQIDGAFVQVQDDPFSDEDLAALMEYTQGQLIESVNAEIIDAQEGLVYAGRTWSEVYFREPSEEESAAPSTVYCFFTPEGNSMYMIFFYCDDPPNELVAADISIVLGDYLPAEQ